MYFSAPYFYRKCVPEFVQGFHQWKQQQHDQQVLRPDDLLANSGGVFTSWLEWVQGRSQIPIADSDAREQLKDRLTQKACEMIETAERLETGLRTAAYVLAARQLSRAIAAKAA